MKLNTFEYKGASNVAVKLTKHGRGLFATSNIPKNFTIENVPVVEFCECVSNHLIEEACGEKFIGWKTENNSINSIAVACGVLMMCNHSENSNAKIIRNLTNNSASLISTTDIQINEEITIEYLLIKTF